MIDELDTYNTEEIVCPYCGHRYSDSWTFFEDDFRNTFEEECRRCERVFHVSAECDYQYSFITR